MRAFLLLLLIFTTATRPIFAQTDLDRLAQTVRAGSVEEKRDALYKLRNMATEEASRAAVPALKDASEIVRATATHSVLHIPGAECAALLLPLLGEKKSPYVREETAYALGKTGSPTAVEALLKVLNKDKKAEVRGAAAFALGLIGDARAVESLFAALKHKNRFVQRSAARSLGQINDANAVPALVAVLNDDKRHSDVRREAAVSLGHIGGVLARSALQAQQNSPDELLANTCREALTPLLKTQ